MDAERARRLVEDMVRHAEAIHRVVRRGREEFFDPEEVRNRATIEHYLELLGEASGAIGRPLRNANPGVPWSALARFRFDSAHPYDDEARPVNYDEIWRFACDDLPGIVRKLRAIRIPREGPRELKPGSVR
jgi:uncharacterized protein with HEPN domain